MGDKLGRQNKHYQISGIIFFVFTVSSQILTLISFRMFEGEIGVKADGLSVHQYLMHGIPCPQTAEAVIADIDEQLVENSSQ